MSETIWKESTAPYHGVTEQHECRLDRLMLVVWYRDGRWFCGLDLGDETLESTCLGAPRVTQAAQAEALRWAHETLLELANKAEALRAAMDEAGQETT